MTLHVCYLILHFPGMRNIKAQSKGLVWDSGRLNLLYNQTDKEQVSKGASGCTGSQGAQHPRFVLSLQLWGEM